MRRVLEEGSSVEDRYYEGSIEGVARRQPLEEFGPPGGAGPGRASAIEGGGSSAQMSDLWGFARVDGGARV